MSHYEPCLNPTKDLAYVAGFCLGDRKDAGREHKARYGLADREQLEYVRRGLVAKLLGRAKPAGLEGCFCLVQCDSVVLSDFLNQDVRAFVETFREFIGDFLSGLF